MKKTLQYLPAKLSQTIPALILTTCLTISSLCTIAQVPNGPTEFQATQVGNTIELDWFDNADNETGFVIQKEWDDEFSNNIQITLPANTVHYVDTEVQPNIPYYYTLWAENESGASADESAVGIVNTVAPPAPANLSAVAGPLMSIEVTFTDNSDLETYYEIHHTSVPDDYFGLEKVNGGLLNSVITHYISDGPYNPYGPPPPDEVFYLPNTLVYIKVRAVINDHGSLTYSPFSPVVTVLTNPVPATPTDFTATAEGNDVHLTWTDNAISEAAYFLAKFEGEFTFDGLAIIQLPADATGYTDLDVPSNIEHHYWLIAIDDYEYKAWPPQFHPELFMDDSRVAKTSIMILELPPAPTDVVATAISPTSMLISFTDNSDIEYWYELLVTASEDESSVVALFEGPSHELGSMVDIEVTDLTPGTMYFFRVRGAFEPNNVVVFGPYSEVISASTPEEPALTPEPPVAEPATAVTAKSFIANWSAVEGATYYELDVFDNKDGSYAPGYEGRIVFETFENVVIKKRSAHHYSYLVRAVNENGESENSNIMPVGKIKHASLAQGHVFDADDLSEVGISIVHYPNPVRDKFQILVSSPDERVAELHITNPYGNRILSQTIPTNELVEMDATSYPAGMYILRAVTGTSAQIVKVIKR